MCCSSIEWFNHKRRLKPRSAKCSILSLGRLRLSSARYSRQSLGKPRLNSARHSRLSLGPFVIFEIKITALIDILKLSF